MLFRATTHAFLLFPLGTAACSHSPPAAVVTPTSRPTAVAVGGPVERAVRDAEDRLNRKIPELTLEQEALEDAVATLRTSAGVNIVVDWKVLKDAGLDHRVPVTARVRNVRLSKVLEVVLRAAGGGRSALAYTVNDEGAIVVSTAEALDGDLVTRIYDISDLIVRARDDDDDRERRAARARQCVTLITETIGPAAWRGEGSRVQGRIDYLSGQLIVAQTRANHRAIARLLIQLHSRGSGGLGEG